MPFATKGRDSRRVYFEDDGGDGAPVVFHGGQLDAVADLRESALAHALPNSEFRLVYVDHRGLGTSDKPHDPEAYRMPLRVADAVAVLDQLGIHRAHFIRQSWGAAARVRDRREHSRWGPMGGYRGRLVALRPRAARHRPARRRVTTLGLTERQRLERDLHDGAQQRLVALVLTLRMARERPPRRDRWPLR
jgi:pimeloyl-ACP methyl ester carboxylesterase